MAQNRRAGEAVGRSPAQDTSAGTTRTEAPQLCNLSVAAHAVKRSRRAPDTFRTHSGYRRRFPAAVVLVYAAAAAAVVALIGLFCAGLWLVAP